MAMQYCELFDQIKATLEDFNHRVVPFAKIAFRSGNSHVVQDISTRLKHILLTNDLAVQNCSEGNDEDLKVTPIRNKHKELRKVFTFLLLNTNISYPHDIGTLNTNVCHILKICPLLPSFLFVDVIWSCGLDTFYYEFLSYAPPWMTYQYYEAAIESLHYIDSPYDFIDKAAKIIIAAAVSITLACKSGVDAHDSQPLGERQPSSVVKLLLYFNNNNSHKTKLKKRELKRFMGFVIRHLLETSLTCIGLYKTPAETSPECEIYNAYRVEKSLTKKRRTESPVERNTLLEKLIFSILNTLQSNLMCIDIDMFLEWTEEEVGGGYENLQAQIGALAFELIERLNAEKALKHDVCAQLQQFAIKPIAFEERVDSLNVGQLLHMLEDTTLTKEQLTICLNVLFKKPIVFGNDECLETIRGCVHLLNIENCKTIIDFIAMDIERAQAQKSETESADSVGDDDEDEVDGDYVKLVEILHQAFAKFSCKEKLSLLVYRERKFAALPKCASLFELPNFRQRSTVYWNSFVHKFKPEKFIILCFENSDYMWQKFFHMVLYNEYYVSSFLCACIATKSYAGTHHVAKIRAAIKSPDLVLSPTFNCVLSKLFYHYFNKTSREHFIKYTLVNIKEHLASERYAVVYVLLNLLDQVGKLNRNRRTHQLGFAKLDPYVILSIANVMNQTRWTMYTFSKERVKLVDLCCKLLITYVDIYIRRAHPGVRRYLCKQAAVLKFTRFTNYYLQKFCTQNPRSFTRYMLHSTRQTDETGLSAFIVTILKCSGDEIFDMLAHPLYREQLICVMNVTAEAIAGMENETAYENYMYLYENFATNLWQRLKSIKTISKRAHRLLVEEVLKLVTTPAVLYPRLMLGSTLPLSALLTVRGGNSKLLLKRMKRLPACKEQEITLKCLKYMFKHRLRLS